MCLLNAKLLQEAGDLINLPTMVECESKHGNDLNYLYETVSDLNGLAIPAWEFTPPDL
jgi:hypothetical protein